jgi:hypothetical protein
MLNSGIKGRLSDGQLTGFSERNIQRSDHGHDFRSRVIQPTNKTMITQCTEMPFSPDSIQRIECLRLLVSLLAIVQFLSK